MASKPQTKDPQKALEQMSPLVRTFLFSPENQEKYLEVLKKNGITPENKDLFIISPLVGDIDLGLSSLANLPEMLTKKLGWTPQKAQAFSSELAGFRYLPIASALDLDVAELIKNWGGNPTQFPGTKINVRALTAKELADEIVLSSHLEISPEIKGRAWAALVAQISGERTPTEALDLLTRPQKIGGAALDKADINGMLELLRLSLANTIIVPNHPLAIPKAHPEPPARLEKIIAQQKEKPIPARVRMAEPLRKPLPALPPGDVHGDSHSFAPALVAPVPPPPALAISVSGVIRDSGLKITDPDLKERLRSIVEARLRGIRNIEETRTLLMRLSTQNGLGLTPVQTAALMNTLEAERFAREKQAEHSKTRERIIAPPRPPAPDRSKETEAYMLETFKKSKILEEKELLLPPSQKPELKKAIPTFSPNSVTPPPGAKPRLDDVQFDRRARGPADELRTMTLVEFRRLSRDPSERALKIHDRINLLREVSFDRFTEGVHAWAQSEPNKLYLDLAGAALTNGKPLTEIITERETTKIPTLTIEEFRAILTLNQELRS